MARGAQPYLVVGVNRVTTSEFISSSEDAFEAICCRRDQLKRTFKLIQVEVGERKCVSQRHKVAFRRYAPTDHIPDESHCSIEVDNTQLSESGLYRRPTFSAAVNDVVVHKYSLRSAVPDPEVQAKHLPIVDGDLIGRENVIAQRIPGSHIKPLPLE